MVGGNERVASAALVTGSADMQRIAALVTGSCGGTEDAILWRCTVGSSVCTGGGCHGGSVTALTPWGVEVSTPVAMGMLAEMSARFVILVSRTAVKGGGLSDRTKQRGVVVTSFQVVHLPRTVARGATGAAPLLAGADRAAAASGI